MRMGKGGGYWEFQFSTRRSGKASLRKCLLSGDLRRRDCWCVDTEGRECQEKKAQKVQRPWGRKETMWLEQRELRESGRRESQKCV